MGIYLNPGNALMYNSVTYSEIYIDKSMMIEVMNSKLFGENKEICVSRPRRFGKSMMANMLVAYYSRGCDSKNLFSKLKISKTSSFEKHLNKYNVIYVDMQKFLVKSKNIPDMIQSFEENIIADIKEEFDNVKMSSRPDVSRVLNTVYFETGIPFVIVIDEWDCVLREYSTNINEQKAYLDYLYVLLKNQPYVALAYMTGILPIKKYGKHSALNMFVEYSMQNQRELAEFTGFTEDEVKKLCTDYDMNLQTIKKWYDGYNVRKTEIYNPRSVVLSMTSHDYDNYWTQTETYEALKRYIQINFDGLKEKIERMIAGEKVSVDTGTFQNDMTNLHFADDVLTLLIHLGYLTYDFDAKTCWIPNQEVADEFIRSIKGGGWERVIDAINQSEECLDATLNGDEKTVAQIIEQTHLENTSIIKYNDENALACIVTLAYYTAKNKYEIMRELPSGKGYADIAFIPRPGEKVPAIVVELKKERDASIAIAQIKNKQYVKSLESFNGDIILVGINYNSDINNSNYKKHTCKIEKINLFT